MSVAIDNKTKVKAPKPKYNMWQNSAFMISLAWKHRKSVLWLCVAVALLAVATSLLGLLVTPVILGRIEAAASVGQLISVILAFAAGLMLINAVRAYTERNTLFGRIDVRLKLVNMVNTKSLTTSYPNRISKEMQTLYDRAFLTLNGNSSAGEAIWVTLTDLLKNAVGFAIYLSLLSSLDLLLAGVVLVTGVGGFLITRRINGWGYRHRDEEAEYSRRMNYIATKAEDYKLAKDIRMFGMRGWLIDVYDAAMNFYESFIARREKVYIWADVIDLLLALLRNGAAYAYLIALVLADGLSASQFLLYFTAVGGFAAWVTGILTGLTTLNTQSLELCSTREYIEYPELFLFEEGKPIEPNTGNAYQIELRGVSYRYAGADADTLSNINLIIKPGEKLAVVGLNGAGKTTLVKLICGFLDPTAGAVLLNGEDIRQYNRRDIYRHFAAVFQEMSLLAGSLAANISQMDEGWDMEKVRACGDRAGFAEKIAALPNGYETNIGKEVYEDGVELSGGETQRLLLARALYKDAPILVLDEPTAALDPIAESDVYNRYNDLTFGRTSVYISHRLASTRFCDRILLIDGNVIAEEGTHESLMASGGKYAELFEVQSHYYKKEVMEYEQ